MQRQGGSLGGNGLYLHKPSLREGLAVLTVWRHNNMSRRYLPTFAELVDRLSIVQLKEIFLPERREEYRNERHLIMHDIDIILTETGYQIGSTAIHAIMMLMLTNRYIWENESRARAGGAEQD